jgi:uncharacterized protein
MRVLCRKLLMPAVLLLLSSGSGHANMVLAVVHDDAKFFSDGALKKANDIVREIKREFKHDLLIETFPSIPPSRLEAYKKVAKEEDARNRFFNEWARAQFKEAEVNGVYILICKSPGRIQVEDGNFTDKKLFTPANRKRLEEILLTKFRDAAKAPGEAEQRKLHDEALIEACEYVLKSMRTNTGS